jgi:aspartate aminotransferase
MGELKLGWMSDVLGDSPTLKLSGQAKALLAAGEPVVNLTAGEPDFPTPALICEAAHQAIDEGHIGYTAAAGMPKLRERIAAYYAERMGVPIKPSEVIVSNGAKQVLYNALSMLLDQGDEVAVPVPYWVTYPAQITALRGRMIPIIPTQPGWKITAEDLERAGAGRAKALIFNTPSNPSGAVYTRRELEDLVEYFRKTSFFILTDEIYEDLVYTEEGHVPLMTLAPDLRHRIVTVSGLSKSYAMTGWRVGFGIADEKTISAMTRLQSHSTSNVNTIAQKASLVAFDCRNEVETMAKAFKHRRDVLVEEMSGIPGLEFTVPDGAFYLMADIRGLLAEDRQVGGCMRLAEHLLAAEKVAVVPGEPFGVPNHLRLSYADSEETLREAGVRFRRAIETFGG